VSKLGSPVSSKVFSSTVILFVPKK